MQRIQLMARYALPAVLLMAAAGSSVAQPSFPTRLEESFDKIDVQGGGILLVEFGSAPRAVLPDGIASAVRISVESGTLRVICPAPCAEKDSRRVRVTVPALSSIRITNGGKVEIGHGFPTAPGLNIDIRNGGSVDAALLRSESVTANIRSGGTATVFAASRLSGRVAGGGSITYFGDPRVSAETSGGGAIRRAGPSPGSRASTK